ncbi:MAG: hypothetical protein NVS1B4_08920 [Gemmatimonadaceae bacterium]
MVARGVRVNESVAATGPLEIAGIVNGDVVALDGDVTVRSGGVVIGDAVAIGGQVRLDGGRVTGEMRSLSAIATPSRAALKSPLGRTKRELGLALGFLCVSLVLGIGALIAAERNVEAVAATIERDFGRSFWVGLASQLAVFPVLTMGIIALAMTVVGIVLVPVAAVAYLVAVAGVVALGWVGVSAVIGSALTFRAAPSTQRTLALRSLLTGMTALATPSLIAGALAGWTAMTSLIMHIVAVTIAWVAATVGIGAVVLSRGGHAARPRQRVRGTESALAWETPTPVVGVVAARRPTPVTHPDVR